VCVGKDELEAVEDIKVEATVPAAVAKSQVLVPLLELHRRTHRIEGDRSPLLVHRSHRREPADAISSPRARLCSASALPPLLLLLEILPPPWEGDPLSTAVAACPRKLLIAKIELDAFQMTSH
jgi:hypothetical protein